jgi:hypothetical protein
MPSKKIKMTAEQIRAANARKGMICNLPFWTCPKCDMETATEGHVGCTCGRPYKLSMGWVDVHKPLVRAMAADGYVFPKGTVEWANTFYATGYYAELMTAATGISVYTDRGVWLGWCALTGEVASVSNPDNDATVVRVGKLAIEHFGNTAASKAAEV